MNLKTYKEKYNIQITPYGNLSKIHSPSPTEFVSLNIPIEWLDRIEDESEELGTNRAGYIKLLIHKYFHED